MATFGEYIKQEREKKGWTQTELGAKIGINSSAISRIENGSKQLSSNKLQMIADIFHAEVMHIKELYYSDKFAKEAYENECPETAFQLAVKVYKHIANGHIKQSELSFENKTSK